MIKDSVCNMQVDENLSKITSNHEGKTYHFCSTACKEKFDTKPKSYFGGRSEEAVE